MFRSRMPRFSIGSRKTEIEVYMREKENHSALSFITITIAKEPDINPFFFFFFYGGGVEGAGYGREIKLISFVLYLQLFSS